MNKKLLHKVYVICFRKLVFVYRYVYIYIVRPRITTLARRIKDLDRIKKRSKKPKNEREGERSEERKH